MWLKVAVRSRRRRTCPESEEMKRLFVTFRSVDSVLCRCKHVVGSEVSSDLGGTKHRWVEMCHDKGGTGDIDV